MTHGRNKPPRQTKSHVCLFYFLTAALALSALSSLHAQSRSITPTTPDYSGFGKTPTRERGQEILDDFRARAIEGDYYFEFLLRILPPKSSNSIEIPGRIWGSRNSRGPITRLTLWPGSNKDESQFLIQNGPRSGIWSWNSKNNPSSETQNQTPTIGTYLKPSAMFEPIAGSEITPFDLQMPFIFWDDFVYEGVKSSLGRPSDALVMRPPPEIATANSEISGVRIYIDTGYHAITTFEVLGKGDKILKTMTLKEVQQVAGQWILRKVELLNHKTGVKADFRVQMAGVKLTLPHDIFSPENLHLPAQPPPLDSLWKAR